MKCSMTGQEKGDFLIQVTAWEGLTVHVNINYCTVKPALVTTSIRSDQLHYVTLISISFHISF